MTGADPSGRGPLWVEFTRSQGGQAINHLARSFHLPRPKAKAAVLSMLGALTQRFEPIRVPIELVEVCSNLLLVAGNASRDERLTPCSSNAPR
jgi:hypothetical protein